MKRSRLAKALSIINLLALTLTMVMPLSVRPVMAQATTGTMRGVVTDVNGEVVAGASVKAKNEATGAETPAFTTTGEGTFEFSNLQPGKYTVTIEGTGFKRSVITHTDVKVGVVNPIDAKLEAGNIAETVTVVAGTEEVLNTEQAQISHTFEARKVEDLPSNAAGGGLDTLALLIPGVAQNSGGGTNTNGTGLSVNGNRGRSNNFQIDGSDNNDLSVGGPNLFIDNQDQVQEYQVVTNNFSAQYGRNLGAVVNIVTKGGTNDFHGTGFEYHRDQQRLDTLTNRERLTGQKEPARFLSNVFGGTFGGPIVRNRAFFFGSYEGIRQPSNVDVTSTGFAIPQADLARLASAFPNNPVINSIVKLNPTALSLGTIFPRTDLTNCNATTLKAANPSDPNQPWTKCNRDFIDFNPTTNPANAVRVEGFLIERIWPNAYTQNEYSVRGDVKVTNRDNFYLRYLKQNGTTQNSTQVSLTNGFHGDVGFDTRNFGGTYIRQFTNKIVNEFRGVRTKLFVSFGGGCDPKDLGCVPNSSQIDQAQIESITPSAVTGVTLTGNSLRAMGAGSGFPQGRDTILYDFADNLTVTEGQHSIIVGAQIKYTAAHVPFLPNYGGAYTFAADATQGLPNIPQRRIFNNAPSAVSIALGNPNVAYTEWDQYYFFQDDFKLRPNLTLNLGVRYEYTGQPINDLTNFTIARESGSTPFWNPALPIQNRIVPQTPVDKNNFAPRIGFAWSPRIGEKGGFVHRLLGNDETVIRGGYAIAYDPAFYNILLNVANVAPFSISLATISSQTPSVNPAIQLPNSFFGEDARSAIQSAGILPIGKLDPKWLSQTVVAPNFRSPYSQQWSFGIQRSFRRNNVGEIRYVGNHGVGLFQSVLRNPFVGVPGSAAAGGLFGFNRTICTNAATKCLTPAGAADPAQLTTISFPSFASKILPTGVTGLTCVNDPNTPDDESVCNGRILPRGAITSRDNTAQSNYHSLQARYNGRFLRNALNLGAAYTFSKTIDDSSEVFAFNGENSILPQNPFDYHSERGISALHRPHIFSMNAIYDVPYFKEQRGFLGHLLGGWQINATHVINSGRRYTPGQNQNANRLGLGPSYLSGGESLRPFISNPNAPQTLVGISQVDAYLLFPGTRTGCATNQPTCILPAVTDVNGFLSLNDLNNGVARAINPADVRFIYNGPGAAKIFGTPYGNSPRYNLVGPILNQTNIGFFKNTRVFENVRIQFRAELFNAFNHPNIGYGVTRNSSIPSGILDNAGNASTPFADNNVVNLARRVVQFGLRVSF